MRKESMGKEKKIATQVVTATATCVTVETCEEWGCYTHCLNSFFSCPYALDGLHIQDVSGYVTVRQSCKFILATGLKHTTVKPVLSGIARDQKIFLLKQVPV
jgi:hypothetical protein